mgnify:CR=1 FL=1
MKCPHCKKNIISKSTEYFFEHEKCVRCGKKDFEVSLIYDTLKRSLIRCGCINCKFHKKYKGYLAFLPKNEMWLGFAIKHFIGDENEKNELIKIMNEKNVDIHVLNDNLEM